MQILWQGEPHQSSTHIHDTRHRHHTPITHSTYRPKFPPTPAPRQDQKILQAKHEQQLTEAALNTWRESFDEWRDRNGWQIPTGHTENPREARARANYTATIRELARAYTIATGQLWALMAGAPIPQDQIYTLRAAVDYGDTAGFRSWRTPTAD